jgi:acyl-CoA thioester hydrolase
MRFDVPEDKIFVHETRVPIEWGDMDALGHVNNATYFRYMENARVGWMHAIGAQPDGQGLGPVIVNTFCNFLRPLVFPGEVVAKLYVARPGRSSFDSFVTMERADEPGVLSAAGGATIVWFDATTQRSVPLPAFLREHLQGRNWEADR